MKQNMSIIRFYTFFSILCFFIFSNIAYSQYAYKWMSVGSLNNYFTEIGSEIEEGIQKNKQQNGLQWPAIYANQDIQCAKALWIGCTNFSSPVDPQSPYPFKVVHVGPRVSGAGEFFPQEFKMISKFAAPEVFVDGDLSYDKTVEIDQIDPNLIADRMIINKVNTQLGITMTRKIFQFSQEYHDNYIITEYTFKNTGVVEGGQTIPPTTLTGVYFYYHYRLAVCANSRHVIGNPTGWGINSMLDVITKNDPENFRAQYMWQGKYPPFVLYDNIGGPIWNYPGNNLLVAKDDTVGRLAAYQFAGVATLHADVSPSIKSDDPNQPTTTSYEGSDEKNTSGNSAYDTDKMRLEYEWIARGRKTPTHAKKVEPTGLPGWIQPTADPSLGTPGGFSNADGYGPYTLAPGDSITIIVAEAVSGISRELATETGIKYKRGQISALQKNTIVFQGRDSLFQTFRRAIANYESGYNIPQPPLPPKLFNVDGLGDRISLNWETFDNPGSNLEGFEIYRAVGKYDSTYYLIYSAGANERSFNDVNAIRGLNYFYYIVSVGSSSSNTGVGLTPPGKLRSSRYYTQTYNPAVLKRPAGDSPFAAKLKGNKAAPFLIQAGVNDKLKINIDGKGPVEITFPADSAAVDSIKIEDIVAKINLDLNMNAAYDNGYGYLWFTSLTTGSDSKIEILEIANNAYSALGLSPGISTGGKPTTQEALDNIRVVPNPYNISASKELGYGDLAQNRLYFFNIPGRCNIKIYSELGELIDTIEHTDGSGDQAWDSLTSSGQIVVSGIYIAVIEDLTSGLNKIVKFVIIR